MTAEAKYDMTVHPVSALVRSQSNGAAAHQVTFPSCDCADFVNRRGQLIEAGDDIAVTLCKHIAEGLRRVGGWHRAEPAPVSFGDLTHTAVKELLASSLVGFSPREANAVLAKVARDGEASFKASITGLLVDGAIAYDMLASRYSLTVTR